MVLAAVLAVVVAVLALEVAVAPPAAGQVGDERIPQYDVTLTVGPDGTLTVEEDITYDFAGAEDRHGILREIPVRLRYDGGHDRVYPLEVVSVEGSPGTPDDYRVETAGGLKVIRIGDPDETVTGVHRYRITYRVEGALNGFDDHDELYWNAVGAHWGVPVDRGTARVVVPGAIQRVACFTGPTGSSLPCEQAAVDGATASFVQTGMGAYEALTVVVGVPKGVVPAPAPVLEERWTPARAFSLTPVTGALTGGLLALVVALFGRLLWRRGRDRRFVGSPVDVAFGTASGTDEAVPLMERPVTPVEFVPPDGVLPGQVGTLIDERANPLDVTATVVDLAVRGYLRIEEIPKEGWFGKDDWRLVRLDRGADPRGGLRRYERLLLDGLFEGGAEVRLSELRNTFAPRLKKVQDALYQDVVDQGWFAGRPDQVRSRWTASGVGVALLGAGLVWLAARYTTFGLVPVPVVLAGLLLLAGHRWMPRRTARGTGTLRRVQGFRRLIEESEAERARFAEQRNLFSEYLPFAVVFGATEKWARAFAGLDGELPETAWYGGRGGVFNAHSFADSVDSFTVSTAGTIASTPSGSGSSGFGGGGSSGGGGGGGGGGSW